MCLLLVQYFLLSV